MNSDRDYFDGRLTQIENRIFEKFDKMDSKLDGQLKSIHEIDVDVRTLKDSRATWLKHIFAVWAALVGGLVGVVITWFKKGGDQ